MGAPQTLPATFDGWDKPTGKPPDTLPANFSGWDAAAPEPAIPKITKLTNPKLNIAASGENMPEYVGAVGALVAGAMATATGAEAAAPIAGPAAKFLGQQYMKHPIIGPTVASYLIGKLREMPGIGKLIPPSAEIIPWLIGKSGAEEPAPTNPGAPLPEIPPEVRQATGLKTGGAAPPEPAAGLGTVPVRPAYPGAPLPANPLPEQINPALASPARTLPGMNTPEVIRPPAAPIPARRGLQLAGEVEPPPASSPPAEPSPTPAAGIQNVPATLSGDSALRQVLTGQDNAALLKIARSRGVNISAESQLKPGVADNRIINKIIDDFSPEELEGIRAQYIENTRFRHAFGDIGPEAWKTMSLQTYFPDLKLPAARVARTAASVNKVAPAGHTEEDSLPKLQEMLRQVKAGKRLQDLQ